jgi:hypothetical protein
VVGWWCLACRRRWRWGLGVQYATAPRGHLAELVSKIPTLAWQSPPPDGDATRRLNVADAVVGISICTGDGPYVMAAELRGATHRTGRRKIVAQRGAQALLAWLALLA